MKKQLLTGALLLASFFAAQAQESLYTQGFEVPAEVFPTTGPRWGNYDLDGDQSGFGIFSPQAPLTALGFSGGVIGSGNFVTDEQGNITAESPNSDNVLESVAFELAEGESFYASFKLAGSPLEAGAVSPYEVYVIGDAEGAALGAATTAAEFKAAVDALTPALSGANAPASATVMNVDLTAYAGQVVSVMFRHRNGGELLNYLLMDDFTLFSGVLSTDKHAISTVSVYPNPATDVINITNTENVLVNGVTVTDLNGRTVKSAKFAGVADAQVNVSDLSAGVYMVTVTSDKGSLTKKIVKN